MNRHVIHECPKLGRHDTTFGWLLGDVHFDENPRRTFRPGGDLGRQAQRVDRVDEARRGQHVAHLAPLQVADEVEGQAPLARAPTLAWRSWRRFSPTTVTPAAISAAVSSAGTYLPASTSSTDPGRPAGAAGGLVQPLARLGQHGAQRVGVDHGPSSAAADRPDDPGLAPAGARRRGGTRRSARARRTCTPPRSGSRTSGTPGARQRGAGGGGQVDRRAPPRRPRRSGRRSARAPRPTPGSSTGRCPGPPRRPRAPGSPSAAHGLLEHARHQAPPPGVRGGDRRAVAAPQQHRQAVGAEHRQGRPGVSRHQGVRRRASRAARPGSGPVVGGSTRAHLGAVHLVEHPDLDRRPGPSASHTSARLARTASASASPRSTPRLSDAKAPALAPPRRVVKAAPAGASVAMTISSGALTSASPRATRSASASCSSRPRHRPSSIAARTCDSARPIAGPGAMPSPTRSAPVDRDLVVAGGRSTTPATASAPVREGGDGRGRVGGRQQAIDVRRRRRRRASAAASSPAPAVSRGPSRAPSRARRRAPAPRGPPPRPGAAPTAAGPARPRVRGRRVDARRSPPARPARSRGRRGPPASPAPAAAAGLVQQAPQLLHHARRGRVEGVGAAGARPPRSSGGEREAEAPGVPGGAHDPARVLGEGVRAQRPHQAGVEVGGAAVRVDQLAGATRRSAPRPSR